VSGLGEAARVRWEREWVQEPAKWEQASGRVMWEPAWWAAKLEPG
jgi:hypothetical protein